MNLKRKFHQDLNQYSTPASPVSETHTATHTAFRPRKKWLTAPIAVAMAILLSVGAAAAGVGVVKYLNRDILTENSLRLTEVPEGYVGIYSVEDLVQMRRDIENGTGATKYILMSDITFTDTDYAEGGICEGGWVPLDTVRKAYAEESTQGYHILHALESFHGNGHVIRGLRIVSPAVRDAYADRYIGLFGYTNAEIIHLGLEDCTVTARETVIEPFASYAKAQDMLIGVTVHTGAIAGHAEYIGGCYVKGLTVEIDSAFRWTEQSHNETFRDKALYNLNVGGIAGSTTYADACYAEDVTIRVRTEGEPYAMLYAGLIAGRATSCVTSWAQGTIEAEGESYREQNIAEIACNYPSHSFPTVVPKDSFETLLAHVDAHYGKENFYSKLFRAYYVLKDTEDDRIPEELRAELQALVNDWNERYAALSGREDVAYTAFYIFDPYSSPQELERIGAIVSAAFATEEEYLDYCQVHNIRMGLVGCFTLTPEETITEADFEGYDFATLWTLHDGKPRLRIFE